jgi:hypothetical protein
MAKLVLLLYIISLSPLSSRAATSGVVTDLFAQGLDAYRTKDFSTAEGFWRKALHQSPVDASILYNQSLNFIQQKKWGYALAYLRQTQLVNPRHSGAQQATAYLEATLKSRGFRDEETLANSFESSLGKFILLPEVLALHLIASLILILILGKHFRERQRANYTENPIPSWRLIHFGTFFIWLLVSMGLGLKTIYSLPQRATVVSEGSVAIRSGPMVEAAELSSVPEGALVAIREYYQDWLQIRYAQLPVGWVQRKHLLLITPEGLK